MAQDQLKTEQTSFQPPKPNPALKRLEKLVGTWELTGRTLDSKVDNITGRVVISWMPGGFFLEQRGEMEIMGFKVHSLEILGYEPETDTFSATVYSNMDGSPAIYHWDVQGDTISHWTEDSRYKGTFSKDGNTLTGGWRPNIGIPENAGNTYDATMTRVK